MPVEPIVWIEIDVDQCTLTYGSSPCAAVLGSTGERKCFNTFKTCQDKPNYDLGSLTYKFYMPRSDLPKEAGVFPCLQSVSESAGQVNIAGTNPDVKGLGKREEITIKCADFPYGDQYTDKYASERRSGAAQASGVGYDPATRGTFFGKLRARWPYYAGRACRYNEAYYENGVLSEVVTRHYILTDMDFDAGSNTATFKAKDFLVVLDDKNAVIPVANNGELLEDMTATVTEFTVRPEGVGDEEYDASGRVIIDNEIMSFTRVGDVFTVIERGLGGTEISEHSAGNSVQQTYYFDRQRIDAAIEGVMRYKDYVPASYIPTAEWNAEASRWAGSLFIEGEITKPTGVNSIMNELVQLGVSVWYDREGQEIGFKVNRPPDEDTIFDINDDANIRAIELEDRDEERLTDIYIYSDIRAATESPTSGDSYRKLTLITDENARSENEFNDTKIRQIYSRFLGRGNDSVIRIIAKRLLNRFRWSPEFYEFRIKYNPDIKLTSVIRVNSRISQEPTGDNVSRLMQVVSIRHTKPKHEMIVTAQVYQFDQKYALIAPNSTPVYTSATDDEKSKYAFFAPLSDGAEPYTFS